jgi:hypothetical protein
MEEIETWLRKPKYRQKNGNKVDLKERACGDGWNTE